MRGRRERLATQLCEQLRELRIARDTYRVITDIYRRRYPDPVTAEFHARANWCRQRAGTDAGWYQQEAQTTALALLALSTVDGAFSSNYPAGPTGNLAVVAAPALTRNT